MSEEAMKPEDQASQTEAGTAEEEQVKPETKESADKANSEADAESKTKTGDDEDGASAGAKSGVDPETSEDKVKSSVEAAKSTKSGVDAPKSAVKSKVQSGIDAPKSTTKSKVKSGISAPKSSEVKPTKSSKSERRSTTGSQVKSSRTKSGSQVSVKDFSDARIGFIGAGRMTESIVKGLLLTSKVSTRQIFVAAKTTKNLDTFKVQGIATSTRSYDIFGKFDCDVIFMAVHGFVVRNCFKLGGTRPLALTTNFIPHRKRTIYILSLIGGVSLTDLATTLLNPDPGKRYKVTMHRLVLNISVAYGPGLGALDVEVDSKKCAPIIRGMLKSIALIDFVSPDLMDAVCSLIGNGSAFVYFFIAALADGGFMLGLNKEMATYLVVKTMQAAALTMIETNKGPAELRDEATSPSGAAIYGIHVLDKQDCASGIQAAIEASYRRLKELVDVAN